MARVGELSCAICIVAVIQEAACELWPIKRTGGPPQGHSGPVRHVCDSGGLGSIYLGVLVCVLSHFTEKMSIAKMLLAI